MATETREVKVGQKWENKRTGEFVFVDGWYRELDTGIGVITYTRKRGSHKFGVCRIDRFRRRFRYVRG